MEKLIYLRKKPRNRSHYLVILFFAIPMIIPFFYPQTVYALKITLSWCENAESDIAGYKVFFRKEGEAYDYAHPIWEGKSTTCTISELEDDTPYFFVARAFDDNGMESPNSNEVYYSPSGLELQSPSIPFLETDKGMPNALFDDLNQYYDDNPSNNMQLKDGSMREYVSDSGKWGIQYRFFGKTCHKNILYSF